MVCTNKFVKLLISAYSFLRLYQAGCILYMQSRSWSSLSIISYAIIACCVLLLIAITFESRILLEIWLVCTMLKFGSKVFSVFDLNFERDTFLKNSLLINVLISSCEYFDTRRQQQLFLDLLFVLVLQIITLLLVIKLHKSIDDDEPAYDSDSTFSPKNQSENNINDAVAFEPAFLANFELIIQH